MRGYQLKIVLGGLLACALCNRAAAQQQFTADKVIAVVGIRWCSIPTWKG